MMNKRAWNKIAVENQKQIEKVGMEAMDRLPEEVMKEQEGLYREMAENGAKIQRATPELRKSMKGRVQTLWAKYLEMSGDAGKQFYEILSP